MKGGNRWSLKLIQLGTCFWREKHQKLKKLVEQDFSIDTCTDFSLLNLMGYLLLAEKDYASCTRIFEKYILLAKQNEDKEHETYWLTSISDDLQRSGWFS